MQNVRMACFVLILTLCPICAYGLTFTLSDDAIMALDYNDHYMYPYNGQDTHLLSITDVNGPGIKFDILLSDPLNTYGQSPFLEWISSRYGGQGILVDRDISIFNAFGLKFTLLSIKGVTSPDAIGPVIVGSMITQSHYLWAFKPEFLEINGLYNPASAVSITSTDAGTIGTIGFTCYIPYWIYAQGESPWDPDGAIISLLVEAAPDAIVMTSDPDQILQLININKCTIAAGSKPKSDRITISGKINPTTHDLNDANTIDIALDGNYMADACVISVPINRRDYIKTGRFAYSGTGADGVKKSFKLDLKTHKFSFSAQKLDLSGLSCPLNIRFDIADYNTKINIDESIVNGPKKPIPINLLMGIKDSIRVDKINVRYGSKAQTDRLYIKGGISIADLDANMVDSDFVAKLEGQEFTIPANNFKANKTRNRFNCSNVKLSDGSIASADFNFRTCVFTLTIKKANITAGSGPADFSIDFADFSETADVLLP